ncbi:MAG: hypothetical protein QM775_33045 [Pirellulales bacterium]
MATTNRKLTMSADACVGRRVVLWFTLLTAFSSCGKTATTLLLVPSERDWVSVVMTLVTLAFCFMLWKGDVGVKWLFVGMCLLKGVAAAFGLFDTPFHVVASPLTFLAAVVSLSFASTLMFSPRVEAFFEYQRQSLKF